jgi:hypothetical protein
MVHDRVEGWYVDPFGAHAARWFSDGTPTALVRDASGVESHDGPPSPTFEGELQPVPETAASDGDDLLRADGGDPGDQIFDPNAAVGVGRVRRERRQRLDDGGAVKPVRTGGVDVADTFRYEIDKRFMPVLALFGLRSKQDGVQVGGDDEDGFTATFGWLRLVTRISNIDGAHVTRDYRWWTAIGARRSLSDDGLSFGTNYRAGVCVHFKQKVPTLLGRNGHSALTVTVADLEGLVRRLSQ